MEYQWDTSGICKLVPLSTGFPLESHMITTGKKTLCLLGATPPPKLASYSFLVVPSQMGKINRYACGAEGVLIPPWQGRFRPLKFPDSFFFFAKAC